MAFTIICSGCQGRLKASEAWIGKKIQCTRCGTITSVTDPRIQTNPSVSITSRAEANQSSWPPRKILLWTGIGGGVLVLLLLIVLVIVLNSSSIEKKPGPAAGQAKVPLSPAKGTVQKVYTPTASEAKSKLKIALDSWVFGDSLTRFKEEHPNIHFGDYHRIEGYVLQRYEIGTSRQDILGFDFSVILIFQSKLGTEVREIAKYTVLPPAEEYGKWSILGGSN